MSKKWWTNFTLGVLFISLGTWLFMTPLEESVSLTVFFGFALIVAGLFEIAGGVIYRSDSNYRIWHLINGMVDLSIGNLLLLESRTAIETAPYFLTVWLFYKGLIALDLSWELKSWNHKSWGFMFALGCSPILFSILTMAYPFMGGLHSVYTTGLAFLGLGTFNISIAYNLNKLRKKFRIIRRSHLNLNSKNVFPWQSQ